MVSNIRLIAGQFGGRVLDTPKTKRTHPMGERVRNALFNAIGSELTGASVLDAYAGTGALGLEALSRGATTATFIEKDRIAAKTIANNIALLGLGETQAKLITAPVASWLTTASKSQYDIIFVDPPYHEVNKHLSTMTRILGLLKPGALMVLSSPDRCEELVKQNEIVVVDNRSYSNATLTFYRRKA